MKLSISDCNILAKSRQGKCLSLCYVNNKNRMVWECSKGHRWKAAYGDVIRGTWCRICCGNNTKYTLKYCKKMAGKNNGKCLSKKYINKNTHMIWRCANGHIWNTTFSKIISGCWCKLCKYEERKMTLKECHDLALKNNGKCLSTKYINAHSPMQWSCSKGHIWDAKYSKIQQGHWCIYCSVGKKQKSLTTIIKEIFSKYNIISNYKGFEWLTNQNGRRLEIDIWIPELKIAIEYDGEQHFKPIRFGGMPIGVARIKLKEQKHRDKIKNAKINRYRKVITHFIRFDYKEEINKDNVIKKLIKNGIFLG
jgi:hypothetical protein